MDPRATLGLTVLFIVLLATAGCRKEEETPQGGGPTGPTPAFLNVPGWVIDSIGPPYQTPGNPLTVEGIALGRRLFHDPLLSDDQTISCATCHEQDHAFSDPRPFSIGTDGSVGRRNAMAIVNLAWDQHFFWDGRRHSLEQQAHDPVVDMAEMRNTWPVVVQRLQQDPTYVSMFMDAFGTETVDSILVVSAIAQFERTLVSFGSPFDRYRYGGDTLALTPAEKRGMDLFFRDAHCVDCHRDVTLADHGLRNNGLDLLPLDSGAYEYTGNPSDIGRFKVPTLRNIAVTGPYMHDSRFETLEEVVSFYANDVELNSPNLDQHMFPWMIGQVDLDPSEQADLVAFLHALTDPVFLTDPSFGAP
ncbi:MAG: c-type cytochrome [Flavobacteriales bacterium]|nr:c-type cytochrome [Flavobacteriales bacterium]MCB9201343.1 c-type cytochrome [Flavobacteriales bacterium]